MTAPTSCFLSSTDAFSNVHCDITAIEQGFSTTTTTDSTSTTANQPQASITQVPSLASPLSSSSPLSPLSGGCCPVSARCNMVPTENLVEHIRTKHCASAAPYILDLDEQGYGQAEMQVPISVERNDIRRSTLLVQCDGELMLWSMVTQRRADGELQVSVTMRRLDVDEEGNSNQTSFPSVDPSSPSNSSNNNMRRSPSPRDRSGSAGSASSSNSHHSFSSASKYSVKLFVRRGSRFLRNAGITDEESSSAELAWEGSLEDVSTTERQDWLVSRRKALVVLFPTHADAFQTADGKDDFSIDDRDQREIVVYSRVQRLK